MKIKKIACLLMALVMIWAAGCASAEPTVTELTDPPGTQQTVPTDPVPADPGSDGPSKPVDPVDPSAPSEPEVPGVTEPDPSDPVDPSTPSEPEHEHEYVAVMTKATCLDVGFTTYTCDCGDTYVGDRIEATGHQWSDWVVTKEPTVDETGEAVSICAMCENTVSRVLDKVIPNHTHSYVGKVTTQATCTKEGIQTFTCDCGSTYTQSTNKVAHSYKATVTAPTCTTKGYTLHKCSSCGDSYKDNYVAVKAHTFGNYKSNGDATCTKDGTKTGSCSACGAKNTVTDTGSAKGHSYSKSVTAPTCTEKGYTTNKCGVCGDTYKDSYVNATGHKYNSYTSNGDATCTKDGTKTATCANGCGTKDTKTDTGSMVDHDYKVIKTVESFITGPGFQRFECSFCKKTYTEDLPEWTEAQCDQFLRDVEDAIFKYINQFREEEGEATATNLPGMRQVAQYRAVQLQKNFSHDEDDIRDAHAAYQYGEYFDATLWGDDPSYSYYTSNGTEAIAASSAGNNRTADELGYAFACQFRNSPGHWRYLKLSKYEFMSVGIDWSYARQFTVCVMVSMFNYG